MSENEKKVITVLQVTRHVRALLISAPNGLNIIEIQNDYLNIIGKTFPYRELGFKEPIDLLKAMPDVVQPTWIRGELILRGKLLWVFIQVCSVFVYFNILTD